MWNPSDKRAIPTSSDTLEIKKVILGLEEELVQAEHRVQQIRRELEERRAWIAPIRKVNLDVLSLIFEFCGEADWTDPLRLSAVCAYWREVALATPRMWSFVNLREDLSTEFIRLYFERSGQRLLHIGFSRGLKHAMVEAEVALKIQCLSINQSFFGSSFDRAFISRTRPSFLNLLRLRVRPGKEWLRLSDLSTVTFPCLRHLEMNCALQDEGESSGVAIPPLQTLKLSTGKNITWLRLLEGCRSSLVSLSINFQHLPLPEPRKIHLPRLHCLEVIQSIKEDLPRRLIFDTPILKTYIERNKHTPSNQYLGMDLRVATHIYLNGPPFLSMIPQVRVLQIKMYREYLHHLVVEFDRVNQNCPGLEIIELHAHGGIPFTANDIKELKEHGKNSGMQGIRLVINEEWISNLPGFIDGWVRLHPESVFNASLTFSAERICHVTWSRSWFPRRAFISNRTRLLAKDFVMPLGEYRQLGVRLAGRVDPRWHVTNDVNSIRHMARNTSAWESFAGSPRRNPL